MDELKNTVYPSSYQSTPRRKIWLAFVKLFNEVNAIGILGMTYCMC
jgi:hypothetical protein